MRRGMSEAPILAVTRYAVGGKDCSPIRALVIDMLMRRECNATAEDCLRKDLGTTCQKRTFRMVLYGSKWAMVKEVRMMEDCFAREDMGIGPEKTPEEYE